MANILDEKLHIAASPESIFEAWTESRHMTAWWGQEGDFQTIDFQRDLRVGGQWSARFRDKAGNEFSAGGTYLRVDRPNYLSFTWKPEWDAEPATTIEMEFLREEGGTLLKFRQHGLASENAIAANKAAWGPTLDWLRCYLTSKE